MDLKIWTTNLRFLSYMPDIGLKRDRSAPLESWQHKIECLNVECNLVLSEGKPALNITVPKQGRDIVQIQYGWAELEKLLRDIILLKETQKSIKGKCDNCHEEKEIYRDGLCVDCYKKLRKPPFVVTG